MAPGSSSKYVFIQMLAPLLSILTLIPVSTTGGADDTVEKEIQVDR